MTRATRHRRSQTRGWAAAGRHIPRPAGGPIFWLSAVLISVAFVTGGASRENALSTMMIELVSVALLAAKVWWHTPTVTGRVGWPETALLAGVILVPLLQLVPLPPDLWSSLPGRHEALETLRLAGIEAGWAPISLDPEATFRGLLWLTPSVVLFLAVADLDAGARFRLAGVILALCIASLVLGGLQITDPNGSNSDLPVGFFTNRNHQGIAMAAALPIAAAFAAIWGSAAAHRARAANIAFAALLALLIVGVLVTRSRAALSLAAPALIASIGLYWAASRVMRWRREVVLMIAVAAVALVFAGQFAISAVFDRFETLSEGDGRFYIWPSVVRAGADVAPVGSGLGTFEPIYRAWEPLNLMGPNFVNHAHNDYLELWLETGWFGPLVLAIFLLWLGRASIRAWSGPATPLTILARAGSITALVLLAHSFVDYPLRTQALACVFAFAVACLTVRQRDAARKSEQAR